MSRLIESEELIKRINNAEENFKADHMETIASDDGDAFVDGVLSGVFNIREMVNQAPTVSAIPLEKVKTLIKRLEDEKECAYADFDDYKRYVLEVDTDELPEDEYRYGIERCLRLLNKLIAESEEV